MRFKIRWNVYLSMSISWHFSCSITWPNLQCLPDHVELCFSLLLLFRNGKAHSAFQWSINRMFTKYNLLGWSACCFDWVTIHYRRHALYSKYFAFACLLLHSMQLAYLAGQNQINVAWVLIHSCTSLISLPNFIADVTSNTLYYWMNLEQYLNWVFEDEH